MVLWPSPPVQPPPPETLANLAVRLVNQPLERTRSGRPHRLRAQVTLCCARAITSSSRFVPPLPSRRLHGAPRVESVHVSSRTRQGNRLRLRSRQSAAAVASATAAIRVEPAART